MNVDIILLPNIGAQRTIRIRARSGDSDDLGKIVGIA